MKNEKAILYGIIGLLIGVVLTIFTVSGAVNSGNAGMMQMLGVGTRTGGTQNIDRKSVV